jgi:hypothetical protein
MSSPASPSRRSARLLAACLAAIVVCALLASLVQRSGGSVQLTSIVLPAHNGQWIAADLFRPRSATAENPAPAIVVVPGFQRSKESLSNLSIELARRGFVVIAIDPYAQGNSSSSLSLRAATTEGYGLFAVVDYLADTGNLNYIDRTRIGATGHSAGGNAAILAAAHFGREARRTGRPSKLHSVFVSGYLLSFTENILRHVRSNVGTSYALHDEGAYRNELKNGDLRIAPEALRLINLANPSDIPVTEVEFARYYGDVAARTLRVLHNERIIHPFQPYSITETASQISYFEHVFGWDSGLQPGDQVWYWKELLTLLCLLAAFISIVPLARLLVTQIDWFHPVAHPARTPAKSHQHPAVFWGLLVTGAAIACVSYIPMTELSQRLFVDASNRAQTWFFPQRMNNAVMLWALFNGVAGFGLFLLGRKLRRADAPQDDNLAPSVRVSASVLGRTAVLAFTLFAAFFGLLFTIYSFFHVDYRFLWIGARAFEPELYGLVAVYAPAFLPFFLVNSLRVNCGLSVASRPEWLNLLLAGVSNSLGLLLIVAIQYVTFAITGTVYWTDGWLYINLLFAVVPIMFVLPYFNRHFYLATGRIYLGPLTMVLIFITIMISNTVCYLPF